MKAFQATTLILTICLCCAMLAGCGQQSPPAVGSWVTHTSDDGRASIKFPATPKIQTEAAPSPLGPLLVKLALHERSDSAFAFNQLTYPVSPDNFDAAEGLKGAVKGSAANINGTVLSSTDINNFGLPGKEVLIQGPDGVHLRGRIYIDPAGPTMFQALYVGTRKSVDGPVAESFLDSLEIK